MSVEDWARREAERAFDGVHIFTAHGFQLGIVHAFDALLSDEAVEAAARANLDGLTPSGLDLIHAQDVLEAAFRAVTEGERP